MLSLSIVKQGGIDGRVQVVISERRIVHDIKWDQSMPQRRHAAHRQPAGTTQRRSSASDYSYTSRASVPQRSPCCVVMIQQQQVVRARHGNFSVIVRKPTMLTFLFFFFLCSCCLYMIYVCFSFVYSFFTFYFTSFFIYSSEASF